jgi:hypothetical protein
MRLRTLGASACRRTHNTANPVSISHLRRDHMYSDFANTFLFNNSK